MDILTPHVSMTYSLLDSGNGHKLEEFGSNVIIRPDSNCIWQPRKPDALWKKVQATYLKNADKKSPWSYNKSFKEPWHFSYTMPAHQENRVKKIVCELRASSTKNIGVFPEQASHWDWMARRIQTFSGIPNVLNLFGYTGVATLVAAAAGANVCHVDASQAAIHWGRLNQELSKLEHAPIRWIVDDCAKFVAREIKRGVRYDGLIMDPPAFGRDNKGNVFEFEKNIQLLLSLVTQVLTPKPLFVIFNGYSMGYSAMVLCNVLKDVFPRKNIEFGELHLQEATGSRTVPCSLFARFSEQD